jgi:uncharacterized protein YfiM (DUF2279 family)
MKTLLASILIASQACAHANDESINYAKHLAGSAAISAAVTAATKDELIGFGVSVTIGVAKEIADSRQPGNKFCVRDLAFDIAGAYIGAKAGGFIITPQRGGLKVGFVRSF